jgi:histidyl-tRNA synthetase
MAKQFRYANQLGIPFVITIGPDEAKEDRVALKEMASGQQEVVTLAEAVARVVAGS